MNHHHSFSDSHDPQFIIIIFKENMVVLVEVERSKCQLYFLCFGGFQPFEEQLGTHSSHTGNTECQI